jgi:predicted lipoprotein
MDKKIMHLVVGLLFILTGCSSSKKDDLKPEHGFDRKAMLTNFADNIIKPSYDSFKQSFDLMKTKSEDFLNAPSVTGLQEFRSAWKDAYIEWQKVELFEVGPAEEEMLRTHFNIYPFNAAKAESNITSGVYNLDEAGQISAQGFPAIDYFLNGTGEDDAAILAWFNDPTKGANRKKYLRDVVGKMSDKLQAVVSEWNGSYRNTFINNVGTDVASSTGKLVNAYILHYERFVRSGKVGIPAGIMGSSLISPAPEKVEAFYQRDLSKELALTAQQAVLDFYRGKSFNSTSTGPSFKTYFAALGSKGLDGRLLADILDDQFGKAMLKLNDTQADFYKQIQTDRSKMVSVFEEMQLAVRYLKLDMTSAMGISISYTDNDGD